MIRFRLHRVIVSLLFLALTASFCGMIPFFLGLTSEKQVGGLDYVLHDLAGDASSSRRSAGQLSFAREAIMDRKVQFIPSNQLGKLDYFSASWIQPMSTFLKLNTSDIDTVESGVFSVWKANQRMMRMTLDWLDFCVEHLSKYWKNAQVFDKDDTFPFHFISSRLNEYIGNAQVNTNATALYETIAVVAFQPYRSRQVPEHARSLTVVSLAATVASMMQAGFGRILVVGYEEQDLRYAQEAFTMLHGKLVGQDKGNEQDAQDTTRIGQTELQYVRATLEEVTSTVTPINRVKGALMGLKRALKGEMEEERMKQWLGTFHEASFWKYVYLTEPDTILSTRQSAIPQLRQALDSGVILSPHRLQPLPYESDLKGMKNEFKYLPASGEFEMVTQVNPVNGGVCCDEMGGRTIPPFQRFEPCGSFWWQCGFNERRDHSRLESFQLLRLETGTRFVNLAGSEHGRRCIPKANGVCALPFG